MRSPSSAAGRGRLGLAACLGAVLVALPPAADLTPRRAAVLDAGFVPPDSVQERLSSITAMLVAGDGSVYVADRLSPVMLQLGVDGALRRTLGRAGQGPGEFYSIAALGWRGDSVWALDAAQARVTLFAAAGRGVHTISYLVPQVPVSEGRSRPRASGGLPLALLDDGSLLYFRPERNFTSPEPVYRYGDFLRAGRGLEILDTLLRIPMERSSMRFIFDQGEVHFVQPFSDDPAVAIAPDGATVVVVDRRAASNAGLGHFTVHAWSGAGRELWSREFGYAPRRLDRARVDSVVAQFARPTTRQEAALPVTADSILRRLYRPAYVPPVMEVRPGRDGTVWLRICYADGPARGDEWLVLGPDGSPLARVNTPDGFHLFAADRSQLWGVRDDPARGPVLERFRIERGPV